MIRRACAAAIVSVWIASAPATAQAPHAMTNADVVNMTSVKLSDDVIVGAIQGTPSSFDVSAGALIALKQAGVSDAVITAMLSAAAGTAKAAPDVPEPASATTPTAAGPAIIYVYWPKQTRNAGRLSVACDGEAVADVNNGHYVALRAPAGTHTITTKKDKSVSADVSAGKSYYVRLSIEGLAGAAARLMNPEEGAAELRDKASESNELKKTYSSACKSD